MLRRLAVALTAALAVVLLPAAAAQAVPSDKLTVLSNWTQPTAASTATWNAARLNQAAWAAYEFDWTTDYCSDSPDNPLGFNFTNPCAHHDFGYRNYKAVGQFPANKDRVDSMFYEDLKRVCATYNSLVRPACTSLAWTYYQAVHLFGSIAAVSPADIDKAAKIKSAALASSAHGSRL